MIEPNDIVRRLLRRKPFWTNGKPKIELIGESKQFGKLVFVFDKNDTIEYKIWIKDRKEILDVVEDTLNNFQLYCKQDEK